MLRLWRTHTMKNTLLLLRREEDPSGKTISTQKKARFRALGGTGVIGVKPLIATKAFQNIHLGLVVIPKGRLLPSIAVLSCLISDY